MAGDHSHRVVHRRSSSKSDGEESVSTRRVKSSCSWTFAVVLPVLEKSVKRDCQFSVGEELQKVEKKEKKGCSYLRTLSMRNQQSGLLLELDEHLHRRMQPRLSRFKLRSRLRVSEDCWGESLLERISAKAKRRRLISFCVSRWEAGPSRRSEHYRTVKDRDGILE